MKNTPRVDVVVPCYNPPENWHINLIESFNLFCRSIEEDCALILVNDGSTKGVFDENIKALKAAIPFFNYHYYNENKGKGQALREGVKLSEAPLALTTDIDFPYENESMVAVLDELKSKGGLILGYRQEDYYRKVPLFRKLLSISFRLALKTLLNLNVNDTQCGLKGFDKSAGKVFLQTEINGYLYDLELVRKAQAAQVPISRVNVTLKSGVEFTNMKMSILIKEARNFLKILRSR